MTSLTFGTAGLRAPLGRQGGAHEPRGGLAGDLGGGEGAQEPAHGARHVDMLTGFKWLARAADRGLVYAYEEAIGHCVDPDAVRDVEAEAAEYLQRGPN